MTESTEEHRQTLIATVRVLEPDLIGVADMDVETLLSVIDDVTDGAMH